MFESRSRAGLWTRLAALLALLALLATACGGSDGDDAVATDEPSAEASTSDAEEAMEEEAMEEDAMDDGAGHGGSNGADFASLSAPTGDPIVVGFVNSEGPAGLNFPEMQEVAEDMVNYLNDHGGLGNRPIQLEPCIVDASPESSQACAQELAGKNVELVWIGLDLFPDYATYDAANIPIVGALPLFPADFNSSAVYLNGGNAALAASNAFVAIERFGAEKVAIISADNAGANSSEAAVISSLEAAGVEYVSIKGAESETDAGAQGLVRQALEGDPDVLISLYGDAGCIGMIRGRAAIGTDVPVVAASTCTNGDVLDVVGDDALGWTFVPGGDRPPSPENSMVREAISARTGEAPEDIVLGDLGLGGLSPIYVLTTAAAANLVAASGDEVTGQSIVDRMKANPDGAIEIVPDGQPIQCGASAGYPAVCAFDSFIGEYVGDGVIEIVPGFETFSIIDYFPPAG